MHQKFLSSFAMVLACFWPQLSPAQLLKVDVNAAYPGRSDTTAPGFTRWDINGDLLSGDKRVGTHSFTNAANNLITCTVAQTAPTNVDSTIYLFANWLNKNGGSTSTDPSVGWRLAFDGVWVHQKDNLSIDRPYTNGGAMSLTISNLSAGPHTITTYHNDIWGTNANWVTNGNYSISKCIISANGFPVFTNTPSFQVTNDTKCGFAYFTISNGFDGQPVVINFDPDHSGALDFVILNGFAIDGPTPGYNASGAIPADGDEHVFANNDNPVPGSAGTGFTTLSWTPSTFAVSNFVYFGTTSNAVAVATLASPEFKGVRGTNLNVWNVTNLDSSLTYYWRIDQLDFVNGGTNLSHGDVWRFRTRHLAFPGAEGYGRFARGGRGGVVMEVTNLLDYDTTIGEAVIPGSYRAAIEASGPRTVVFRVSGLIRLKRPCTINNANGYVTVAGQTAPGEGICLSQWRAGMSSCSDVIMRFIRCRLGDFSQQAMDGIGLGNSSHSIIDHCSISWTMDEASSSRQSGPVNSGSANITFQRNIISEPLQHSYHYAASNRTNYEQHAFAASISGEIGSYHHNLIAHSTDRNWSLAGGLDQSSHYAGSLDIRNNVVYNWIGRTTDGGVARANYVSNYYKPYPPNPYATWLLKLDTINTNWGSEQYYMVGNVMEGKTYETNNWMTGSFYNDTATMNLVRTNQAIYPDYVTPQAARDAYKNVLSDVGANRPIPDVIDQRIIQEVRDGVWHYEGTNGPNYTINGVPQTPSPNYPGIIDSQTDVHDAIGSPNYPWPAYATYNVATDTDHDGLPDWWEVLKGLNPNSPPGDFSDSNGDPDGDGYSNLEDYLNWLAAPHADCIQNASVDVDLGQFTRGFTNNPVVSNPVNGTVALLTGTRTARFTPAGNFLGLAGFKFAVTDAQGSMTNAVGIHVLVSNSPPTLAPVSNQLVNPGVTLVITNVATDTDVPTNVLIFSLLSGPPNATLGAASAVFTWRPLVTQANSSNLVTIVVTDNGTPNLSATQSFNIAVNPLTLPGVTSAIWAAGQFSAAVSGQTGPDYSVQSSTNLANWDTLLITNSPAMPFTWTDTNTTAYPVRYYRIKVGPPLP